MKIDNKIIYCPKCNNIGIAWGGVQTIEPYSNSNKMKAMYKDLKCQNCKYEFKYKIYEKVL